MNLNPELQRYVWLELGLHRLVAVPLVAAAVVAVVMLSSSDGPSQPLAWMGIGTFLFITAGWGSMRAFASVTEEVRERTWDFQRMAAIRPWAMAWGKMAGAPVFAWYIGSWGLLVFLVAGMAAGLPRVPTTLVGAVALAVLLHGLGVAASALAARNTAPGSVRRGAGLLAMLLLLFAVPSLLLAVAESDKQLPVHWWLLHGLHVHTFAAFSTVLFAAWAAIAAWRCMARELREPGWWFGWPAFAAFVAFWWAGVATPTTARASLATVIGLAAVVLVAATYIGATLDPLTPVSWERHARAWTARAPWHRRVPFWLVHGSIALVLGWLSLVLAAATTLPGANLLRESAVAPVAPVLALMALRDVALVTVFSLTTRVRKPLAMAAFYIAVADLLLPGLASAAGSPVAAEAFCPLWAMERGVTVPLVGMALHLALVLAALAWRLRRRPREAGAQSPWNPPAR